MNRVEFRAEEVPLPEWAERAGAFIQRLLEILGRKNWDVSLLFCSNKYIACLNAMYRNKNEATDVLSFPLGEKTRTGRFTAGDIVISVDALRENSKFFNVSAEEELRRLLIHAILHLSGDDHSTNDAGEPMLKTQEEILKRLECEKIIAGAGESK